jgi:hypothetical protein
MRSSKNLSQAKIAAFTNRVRGGIAFLTNYGPILTQLSSDLLDETVQKRLHCLYSHNYLEFRGSLGDFQSHFETHISMKVSQSNSSVRFQFGHIAKLRNLIDSVVSRLSSIMGTLSIAFLMKLQPILDDREAFFRSQTANTADRDRAVAEIREEMEEIIGRQKELEKGATNLDRMFEVLVTFKNSLGLEEEDEGISLL